MGATSDAGRRVPKVFGIGANKTGTTTLQTVLRGLGLRVAPQEQGELHGRALHRGDATGLRAHVAAHDAFQDVPFSQGVVFAQLDAWFPGSRFVLTHRPAQAWFDSKLRFHKRLLGLPEDGPPPTEADLRRLPYLYEGYAAELWETYWLVTTDERLRPRVDWDLLFDRDHLVARYEARNEAVVRHFVGRPDDLLVVDLTREPDTTRIVDFLGLPRSTVTPMPWENRTADRPRRV